MGYEHWSEEQLNHIWLSYESSINACLLHEDDEVC